MRRTALLAVPLGAVAIACAAQGPVGPATLKRVLTQAKGGQTITLPPGDYGRVVFPARAFSPALRIDASAARFEGLVLRGVSGVEITGGTVAGPGGRSYGVLIDQARDVAIRGMRIGGAHRGVVVNRSEGVTLHDNALHGLVSDGIDIAYSRRVRVERNSCRDFTPVPAVYAADGTRLRDGDHADCIQAWSRPQYPPTSDLLIADNVMEGKMQGIFLGNHVRNGVDDGGFDRVVVRGNQITITAPNGIVVGGARGAEITGNVIRTVPGSVLPKPPFRKVRAKLHFTGVNIRACGNRVDSVPNNPGTKRC